MFSLYGETPKMNITKSTWKQSKGSYRNQILETFVKCQSTSF